MNVHDVIAQLKSQIQALVDQIAGKQSEIDALKAAKQQLVADRNDLQAYLDWKAAQP